MHTDAGELHGFEDSGLRAEGLGERALAAPARALEHDRSTVSPTHSLECLVQNLASLASTDKLQLHGELDIHLLAEHLEGLSRARSLGRILLQEVHTHQGELRIDARHALHERGRLGIAMKAHDELRLAIKRRHPCEQLIEHDARRIDVGRGRHARALGLLGAHVRGGPEDLREALTLAARQELFDDAEVEDLGDAVLVDHHVGRLEIPMNAAVGVHIREPSEELHERRANPRLPLGQGEDLGVLVDGVRLVDVNVEVDALDQLHRVEVEPVLVVEVVKGHEVAVVQAGDGPELAFEVVQRPRVAELQDLERELSSAHRVEDDKDVAHPATGLDGVPDRPQPGHRGRSEAARPLQ